MCPSRGGHLPSRRRLGSRLSSPARIASYIAVTLGWSATRVLGGPSNQDLIEYLGGTATGQTLSTVAYTLTVLSNESSVLVSCSFDGSVEEVGWMGFGRGTAMTDSDIVILWPNSDGSWTLSHRRATSTALPGLLGDAVTPPQTDSTGLLSIVESLSSSSSSDSPAVVTFARPLEPSVDGYTTAEYFAFEREINQAVIFSYGDENPGNEAQDSDLNQHALDKMGASFVDLSTEFTADTTAIDAPLIPVKGESSTLPTGSSSSDPFDSTGTTGPEETASETGTKTSASASTAAGSSGKASATGSSGSTSETGTALSSAGSTSSSTTSLSYATAIKIHGLCGAAAWLFLAPLGVLYARLGRGPPGTTLTKFPWHFFQQTWITTPLTIVAVGLAYHATLGFSILGLLIFQVILGWWTHLSHPPIVPGVPQVRALKAWLHIILGATLIGLGFVQVKLGMEKYGVTSTPLIWTYWG
ncbi:hypothetical protein JCM10212_005972 [Sporobolomyces blumeae]